MMMNPGVILYGVYHNIRDESGLKKNLYSLLSGDFPADLPVG